MVFVLTWTTGTHNKLERKKSEKKERSLPGKRGREGREQIPSSEEIPGTSRGDENRVLEV